MLILKDILKQADESYGLAKKGENLYYMAPEIRPRIESNQVKSIADALVSHVNNELVELKRRIVELENALN